MSKYKDIIGLDGFRVTEVEESNTVFNSMLDELEECLECGYEGPLTLRKRGYVCPECKTLILPTE